MNEASDSGSSLLLWLVAAGVALLSAHVALAWVREAQVRPAWRESWKGSALAAATFGSGLASSMVLALSAEAMSFPLGYPLIWVLLLWLLPTALALPAFALLVRSTSVAARLAAGGMLALLAAAGSAGWLWAAGLRPGVPWRPEYLVGLVLVLLLGVCAALLVAFAEDARQGQRRQLWRLGGATLLGLSLLAGEEVLLFGSALQAQVGSMHHGEVPAFVLCLIGGVLLPMGKTAMALDLEMRRRARRRRSRHRDSPAPAARSSRHGHRRHRG